MKKSIHLKSRHSLKRWLRWNWLRLVSTWKSGSDSRVRKPTKMTDAERTAVLIFMKVLLDGGSKLYYDLHTQECYLRSEDSTLYIFLESHNVKIINSVYGYDVHVSGETETFLLERFKREMSVRRQKFKREALSKVEHSLESTLEKLQTTQI